MKKKRIITVIILILVLLAILLMFWKQCCTEKEISNTEPITAAIPSEPAQQQEAEPITRNFKIPFEPNKCTYKETDILPLTKALGDTTQTILEIKVTAYSSIEGNVLDNSELQQKRADAIVAFLKGKTDIAAEVATSENWEQFKTDILNSKYKQLATMTMTEAQEYIKQNRLNYELEPILKNHRYTQVCIKISTTVNIDTTQITPAAAETTHRPQNEQHTETTDSKVNPGIIIMEHIVNSHEWHIMTLPSGKHVTVPLPVILYSSTSGFHTFMSSKFHHGHERYNNFELATAGDNKGKIVEYDNTGSQLAKLPTDLSVTKGVVGLFIGILLTLLLVLSAVKISKKREGKSPKGLLTAIELLVVFVRDDIAKSAIGHRYNKFMPLLLSFFFLILITNLTGLIPIIPFGANVTGNISVTAALALFAFIGINGRAGKSYWKHIYNTPGVPWFLKFPIPMMPLIELMGVVLKPIVLAIRLFANIMAGHIIVLAFVCLIFVFAQLSTVAAGAASPIALIFVIFISILEVLVAFIQAFVFTLLTAIFIGIATEENH